jgi:ankyrin repeat protein
MAMAQVLLERGADPNAVTRMGNVPLSDAVMNNRTEFVKLLLEFGVRLLFRCQSWCCGTPISGAFFGPWIRYLRWNMIRIQDPG